ncbi:GTP-binding protein, partial [bacterium]
MLPTPLDKYRNIGVAAHIDAGKTTVTERVLFLTGVTERLGEVHEGTAVMDYLEEEQRRGITITAAATTCWWEGHRVNLIDTPGHVDFTIEVERSFRVLDGVVAIFCAVGGVEAQAEAIWRQAQRRKIPRIAFVNKMDREGANFQKVVRELREVLDANPIPVQIPAGAGENFSGIIDLVALTLLTWDETSLGVEMKSEPVPEGLLDEAEMAREEIIEALAELDEPFLREYLEEGRASEEAMVAALRRSALALKAVPVLCGSAFKNQGIQPLLTAVTRYLPSPEDLGPAKAFAVRGGEPVEIGPDANGPLAALVFKVLADRREGILSYFRVYSGEINVGDTVAAGGGEIRVERLFRMHADEAITIEKASVGEIAALAGPTGLRTGDTLSAIGKALALEPIRSPEPVMVVALEPKSEADRELLEKEISELLLEDPSLSAGIEEETGQAILKGMGELHLEIAIGRLTRKKNLALQVGQPKVRRIEKLGGSGDGEAEFSRETPEGICRALVKVRIVPFEEKAPTQFSSLLLSRLGPQEVEAIKAGVA